ncbi:UNKNOWN [Stylonychia lemnae]|uniref:Transmembrane protein n=1 Tax=Stylonychia lemnae TaxID=5949 RepID=A0A077ZYP8_STYLE|nr:UNKNOWN [Stylonychia lemnae]|eukprot:CDW75076.1 UNKNOWN [Stylonychia lemnae]
MQENQDTLKIKFNRFERKIVILLFLTLTILLALLLANASIFSYLNSMFQQCKQRNVEMMLLIGNQAFPKDQDTFDDYKKFQIVNFLAFGVSEFVPIALWTALKAPEDFFNLYNVLPIQKFSIFQSRGGEGMKGSRLSVKSIQEDDDGKNSIVSRNSETDELLYNRHNDGRSI